MRKLDELKLLLGGPGYYFPGHFQRTARYGIVPLAVAPLPVKTSKRNGRRLTRRQRKALKAAR